MKGQHLFSVCSYLSITESYCTYARAIAENSRIDSKVCVQPAAKAAVVFALLFLEFHPINTPGEIYKSLQRKEIDVGIWGNHSVLYYTNQKDYCDLMYVGIEYTYSTYHLPIRKDWPHKADLDANVLSLIESKEFDHMQTKWFRQSGCSTEDKNGANEKQITLKRTAGIFVMFAGFVLMSILVQVTPWIVREVCRPQIVRIVEHCQTGPRRRVRWPSFRRFW